MRVNPPRIRIHFCIHHSRMHVYIVRTVCIYQTKSICISLNVCAPNIGAAKYEAKTDRLKGKIKIHNLVAL